MLSKECYLTSAIILLMPPHLNQMQLFLDRWYLAVMEKWWL